MCRQRAVTDHGFQSPKLDRRYTGQTKLVPELPPMGRNTGGAENARLENAGKDF